MASDADKSEAPAAHNERSSMANQKGVENAKRHSSREKKRHKEHKERKREEAKKIPMASLVRTRNPESRVKRNRSLSREQESDKRQQKEATSPVKKNCSAKRSCSEDLSEKTQRSPHKPVSSDTEIAQDSDNNSNQHCGTPHKEESPAGKVKRRITPQIVSINNWTIPRRRFQPVVKLQEGGGLKMLPLDETDTLDLLDSTSCEDNLQRHITPVPIQQSMQRDLSGYQSEVTPSVEVQTPSPLPTIGEAHLKLLASLPPTSIPQQLKVLHHDISLTLQNITKPPPPPITMNPVIARERSLINLIEHSLIRSTTMLRRRQRKDAALQHIALGDSTSSVSEGTEGSRIQTLREEIRVMEERRKGLEHVINTRVNAHPKNAPPVRSKVDEWDEPEYVQDAADRLELSCLRKELSEKMKVLDSVEAERASTTRMMRVLSIEDKSEFNKFPTLNDRYLMLTLLGCGGFSEVWKAFDRVAARMVAIKVHQISDRWSEEQKQSHLKRTQREYEIQRNIKHENVVCVHECFSINDSSFACVMEYTPDEDLSSHLCKYKTVREREAKLIIKQVLLALRHITDPKRSEISGDGNANRVIHFDLKPGNILFFGHLTIRITDFGLSKYMNPDDNDMELTSQGAGTFWYLPPECFGTGTTNKISPKVDIWSAGVIFYQMLYGKRPFGHELPARSVLMEGAICRTSIEELEFPVQPKVTKTSVDIIKKMLAFDPNDRPDVESLLHEFDDQQDDDADQTAADEQIPTTNILTKRPRKTPNHPPT